MLRLAWGQLRRRGGRTVALAAAILVAALGFTVLTASSSASRLETVGTVDTHARLDYDILVRPAGSRTPVEADGGLIQSGYLSGVTGGISQAQWKEIEKVPGVSVAAPIAMIGYIVPTLTVPVDVSGIVGSGGDAVTRVDTTWTYDNGLSKEVSVPDFAFTTSQRLHDVLGVTDWGLTYGSTGKRIDPLYEVDSLGLTQATRPSMTSYCSRDGSNNGYCGTGKAPLGQQLTFAFPMLVAAIDPVQEARLTGLGTRLASGTGLAGASLTDANAPSGTVTPVLAAASPQTDISAHVRISRMGKDAVAMILDGKDGRSMHELAYTPAASYTITAAQVYRQLLAQLRTIPASSSTIEALLRPSSFSQRFAIGTPRYDRHGTTLVPSTVTNDVARYLRNKGFTDYAPAGISDVAVRTATSITGPGHSTTSATPASITVVGTLPADATTALSDVTSRILSGVTATDTTGADAHARRLLGGRALAPSPNVTGLVQPAPQLITTLAAARQWYAGWEPTATEAPISAVRVRVADVHGADPASRARVRLAAQRIQAATGLQVDITLGASATHQAIANPAGAYGRPALLLSQPWVKKGVAVAILTAVDRKSLILFVLVLLVSALSVANSAVASVRGRRTELGTLACLGWGRRQLFTTVVTELALVAAGAGVLAAAGSLALGAALGTPVTLARALLALPAALLVALAAGIAPAWTAARADPMAAVQPAVDTPRRPSRLRSVPGLGRANAARHRARTALAALGLLIGVATLTTLLAITWGFHGAVVGTILGDAVAIQARTADYAAVLATLALAAFGVANVLYLNIRDRGAELATLRAVGWQERHLDRMLTTEGLTIAVLGATPGALLGLLGARTLAGHLTGPVYAATATAYLSAVALAAAASLASTRLVRRIPTAILLTE